MSLVLITNHRETIYDINKTTALTEKPLAELPSDSSNIVRDSQIENHVRKELEKLKRKQRPYGIMGKPKEPLPNPKDFLRKHTGKIYSVPKEDLDLKVATRKRIERVPNTLCVVYEQMHKLHHNKKNFVQENVKEALKMKPKAPIRKQYTDVTASNFKIVPKEPEQKSNKIFAKIPAYLDRMIKKRQEEIEKQMEMRGVVVPKCKYITRDERKHLLEGLKKNWDELQRVYQGLPILTDTIPKKARKRELEHQLQQLEKDIVLIERHPFLYVYDDEDDMRF